MKTLLGRMLALISLGGLLLSPLQAGSSILLYPLARAFGSPSEAELAKCRHAFQQLQSHLDTSRVVVQPVFLVEGSHRTWRKNLAEVAVREAGAHTKARLTLADTAPEVAPARLGHNQLRYTWERAAEYSRWVQTARPAGDYVWFIEIWAARGKVGAIQVYLLDANGQVAYCRLFNSHQFGPELALEGDAVIRLAVQRFFQDLPKDPRAIFPPYGVG
jgi:hypothetical protein